MKSYAKLTPEGTRDFLFEESDALRKIERSLSELFKAKGYKKVITPTLEFFDVFNRESAGTLPENLYSMTDAYGRLLVLRPDSTLPIARIAATRLKDVQLPLRLYYNQNVFSRQPKLTGYSDETSQSGIELIGAKGLRADLEVISTAIEALTACGAPDYKIEIGHAGFFKALLDALQVDAETAADINEYMETKNFVALNSILDTMPDNATAQVIRGLPGMFGGVEIIEKAQETCKAAEAAASLEYLKTIYIRLSALGLGDKIIIDLSLVHRSNYYTGIVFRGYTEGSGITVLSGGRYDGLIREFGADLPATGFGVQTDALARAALVRGYIVAEDVPDALVFGEDGEELSALLFMKDLIAKGISCENSVDQSFDEAAAYAKRRGIKKLYRISGGAAAEVVL